MAKPGRTHVQRIYGLPAIASTKRARKGERRRNRDDAYARNVEAAMMVEHREVCIPELGRRGKCDEHGWPLGLPVYGHNVTGGALLDWRPPDSKPYCQQPLCGALLNKSGTHKATGAGCPDAADARKRDDRRRELLPKKVIAH